MEHLVWQINALLGNARVIEVKNEIIYVNCAGGHLNEYMAIMSSKEGYDVTTLTKTSKFGRGEEGRVAESLVRAGHTSAALQTAVTHFLNLDVDQGIAYMKNDTEEIIALQKLGAKFLQRIEPVKN
jgi:hypothetical protein